ncbi:MAG: hypothetical protein P1R58_01325 [bacterium]|nr:hypothetical protein [bacterium]
MRNISGQLIILAIISMVIFGPLGCDSHPSKNEITAFSSYGLEGVLVKDANLSTIRSAIELTRNDTILTTATLLFGSDSLSFNHTLGLFDSVFAHQISPDTAYGAGNYSLTVIDPGKYADTLTVAVGGSFGMTISDPPNHQWRPTDGIVSLDWSGSAMAEGYVMAAVKSNLAYSGAGYSVYAGEQVTAGSLRPDSAFYLNAGSVVDTGMYYIYLFAYNGSPDKQFADKLLPVPIPTQLPPSIDVGDLEGHFGSLVVAAFDSLHVVSQ